MVITAIIGIPVFTLVGIIIWALTSSFQAPDVNAVVSHVQSMHCVTWARSVSDGGGVDVRKSVIVQVGLDTGCGADEIDGVYRTIYDGTAKVRDDADFKVDFLVMPSAPKQKPGYIYSVTKTPYAQLTMERVSNIPSPDELASAVDDWMTVRTLVDPRAQLQLTDTDLWTRSPERFTVNSTAVRLAALTTSLPERLRAQAWKVTIPAAGDTPFVAEDSAPPGGVTVDTSQGFPTAWVVDFGRGLYNAWPDDGTREYVYVFRDPPITPDHGFNEISARVFNVDPAQAFNGGQPASPETTAAWPSLTGAVDAIAAAPQGNSGSYSVGVALYGRAFTPRDEHPDSGNSITLDSSLAVFDAEGCRVPLQDHSSPDNGVIEAPLCRHWLSTQPNQ
jgi:hypothetical protein